MGVVNVRVRGGSSGVVGRHVFGDVVSVGSGGWGSFQSSFALLLYSASISEEFPRSFSGIHESSSASYPFHLIRYW